MAFLLSFFGPRLVGSICFGITILILLIVIFSFRKTQRICPSCHRRNLPEARFCGLCGHKFT